MENWGSQIGKLQLSIRAKMSALYEALFDIAHNRDDLHDTLKSRIMRCFIV